MTSTSTVATITAMLHRATPGMVETIRRLLADADRPPDPGHEPAPLSPPATRSACTCTPQQPSKHCPVPFHSHDDSPHNTKCHYCPRAAHNRDHIVPVSRGGLNAWWNRVPACHPCNEKKGSKWPTCECIICARTITAHAYLGVTATSGFLDDHPRAAKNRQARARRDEAFTRPCPHCDAEPGLLCVTATGQLTTAFHKARRRPPDVDDPRARTADQILAERTRLAREDRLVEARALGEPPEPEAPPTKPRPPLAPRTQVPPCTCLSWAIGKNTGCAARRHTGPCTCPVGVSAPDPQCRVHKATP